MERCSARFGDGCEEDLISVEQMIVLARWLSVMGNRCFSVFSSLRFRRIMYRKQTVALQHSGNTCHASTWNERCSRHACVEVHEFVALKPRVLFACFTTLFPVLTLRTVEWDVAVRNILLFFCFADLQQKTGLCDSWFELWWLSPLFCIRSVPGSDFSSETGCSGMLLAFPWVFFFFWQVMPYINAIVASFRILSCPFFSNHSMLFNLSNRRHLLLRTQ